MRGTSIWGLTEGGFISVHSFNDLFALALFFTFCVFVSPPKNWINHQGHFRQYRRIEFVWVLQSNSMCSLLIQTVFSRYQAQVYQKFFVDKILKMQSFFAFLYQITITVFQFCLYDWLISHNCEDWLKNVQISFIQEKGFFQFEFLVNFFHCHLTKLLRQITNQNVHNLSNFIQWYHVRSDHVRNQVKVALSKDSVPILFFHISVQNVCQKQTAETRWHFFIGLSQEKD